MSHAHVLCYLPSLLHAATVQLTSYVAGMHTTPIAGYSPNAVRMQLAHTLSITALLLLAQCTADTRQAQTAVTTVGTPHASTAPSAYDAGHAQPMLVMPVLATLLLVQYTSNTRQAQTASATAVAAHTVPMREAVDTPHVSTAPSTHDAGHAQPMLALCVLAMLRPMCALL